MQKPREERLTELLQEVKQELDSAVRPRELYAAIVCAYASKAIELLVRGEGVEASEKLRLACKTVAQAKTHASREDFYEALCALDLGFFAYSLESYLHEIEIMARQIWYDRKEFMPQLSEAIRAAYLFAAYLRNGHSVRLAFYYTLQSLNHMRLILGHSAVYGNKLIGHVLGSSKLNRLKELLRAYVCKRNGEGSLRMPPDSPKVCAFRH
jgi:hypothetical protein